MILSQTGPLCHKHSPAFTNQVKLAYLKPVSLKILKGLMDTPAVTFVLARKWQKSLRAALCAVEAEASRNFRISLDSVRPAYRIVQATPQLAFGCVTRIRAKPDLFSVAPSIMSVPQEKAIDLAWWVTGDKQGTVDFPQYKPQPRPI
jgi:hypothetical protein